MSRTIRRDKFGNKFQEGNPKKLNHIGYVCRCDWCMSENLEKSLEKVQLKEMKQEVKDFYSYNVFDECEDWTSEQFQEEQNLIIQEYENWEEYKLKQAA